MAWSKILPGNNEKIRNLGSVIRPNWEAIEEGDDVGVANMLQMRSVQLDNRTGLAANSDPITNAGTHYVYSKDDGGGTQEGFMKDSAGNVLQLTNGGKIGSTSMNYEADTISFDATRTYNENNIVPAWGYVASGALSYGNGVSSVAKISTGLYEITFTAGRLTTTSYAVVAMGVTNVSSSWDGSTKTTTNFRCQFRQSADGSLKDSNFFFMVTGGQ